MQGKQSKSMYATCMYIQNLMGPAYDIILCAKVSICHHLNYMHVTCTRFHIGLVLGIHVTILWELRLKVRNRNGWQLHVATTDIKHASC